jgi:hypothetical protein
MKVGLSYIIIPVLAIGGVTTVSASLSNRLSTAALNGPDQTPPSAPRLIDAAADVGCGNFFLDWQESRDNVDPQWALRYEVYMDGELVPGATVIGDYFVELSVDVEPGSTHTFVVRAFDRSGNASAPSNPKTEADTCPN